MGKIPNWECLFVHRKQGLFLSLYVDAITLAGKKPNFDPMWDKLIKHVHHRELTSFIDFVFVGCTRSECKSNMHH